MPSADPPVAPVASILLVDDTPANLFALAAVLKPLGARIVEATSGREAIEHVARESFAVALLDVQMPEMDGFDTAAQIRTLDTGRELPIIFLTAIHRDDGFVKKGYIAGAADYITKPFDADVVRARVRAFVNLYEQREEVRRAQVAIRTHERDEAVRRLVAFERIATAALQTADLTAFLRELLAVFMSAADDADSATILLRDKDELRVRACVGLNEEVDERYAVNMGESFAGTVAAERRPIEISDASTSPLVRGEWLRARGTKALYGVPLLHDGEVLGIAHIGSVRSSSFTAAEKRLFGAMAERAAWAVSEHVKRARLHDILSSAPAMISILREASDDAPPSSALSLRGSQPTPVFVHDFVNAAYASFFGRDDLVGKPLDEIGLDRSIGPLAEQARATGITATADELDLGNDRVIRLTAQPLRSHAGSVDGIVVFAIDVTMQVAARVERARLLELERRARVEAEAASRMKDEFLATVSHELRTPLNAILGWTVTARAKANPETDRALAVVERNARAQARMLEDVLDVSRVVRGTLRLEISEVALNDVVTAALDVVRPAAQAKNIEVAVSIPERITLRADGQRLQQVAWNLLSNAIKFTPKDGRVHLEASALPDSIVLRVTDNGEGIDGSFLAHVFEPFRQADASTTRRHGGLGLGLAIVKQIVDAHGGTIVAESDGPGSGASFTVELPSAPPSERSEELGRNSRERPPLDSDAVHLGGIKILVVDDDDDARTLLAHVLVERGASVAEADSASHAFVQVERFRPDVIVSDIAMPGGDGYGLIRAVRALPVSRGGRTPAIAVTAHARLADGERAYAAGFQGHLSKPVDLSRLVSMVANLGGLSFESGEERSST